MQVKSFFMCSYRGDTKYKIKPTRKHHCALLPHLPTQSKPKNIGVPLIFSFFIGPVEFTGLFWHQSIVLLFFTITAGQLD